MATTPGIIDGTAETMVEDLKDLLESTTNWTRSDDFVVNTGTEKDNVGDGGLWDPDADYVNGNGGYLRNTASSWHNNGYIYEHTGLGIHVLFAIDVSEQLWDSENSGIRFYICEDWNDIEHQVYGGISGSDYSRWSYFGTDNAVTENNAYNDWNKQHDDAELYVSLHDSDNDDDRYVARTSEATYFACVTADGVLNVAATREFGEGGEIEQGSSGYVAIGPVEAKFYDDGEAGFAAVSQFHNDRYRATSTSLYGWAVHGSSAYTDPGTIGHSDSPFHECEWGFVNPHPNDDDFVHDDVVIYKSANREIPVATVDWVVPTYGGSQGPGTGDTVTLDTSEYLFFSEKGGQALSSDGNSYGAAAAGLLHE